MPIDYSKGKIYQIIPICEHDAGDIYIGSTVRPLSERMSKHRCQTTCRSRFLFDKYGMENCKVELIEYFPCETKEELLKREGELQRANKCVNIRVAGRTKQEYRIENSDKILERHRIYNAKNKEQIKERSKIYNLKKKAELQNIKE